MCRHGCAAQGPASEYKADIAQKPEYVCFGAILLKNSSVATQVVR
jgi:hypothetical protein